MRGRGHFLNEDIVVNYGNAIPGAAVQDQMTKTGHIARCTVVDMVEPAVYPEPSHADGISQILIEVGVKGNARGIHNDAIQQSVRAIVIGPTRAWLCKVGEAGWIGAIGIRNRVVQTSGHGDLVADGDRPLLRRR